MKFGIVGAIFLRLSALGHEVFVSNSRGPDTLAELISETGRSHEVLMT